MTAPITRRCEKIGLGRRLCRVLCGKAPPFRTAGAQLSKNQALPPRRKAEGFPHSGAAKPRAATLQFFHTIPRSGTLACGVVRGMASFLCSALFLALTAGSAAAQQIPDVRCQVEDYPLGAQLSWQSTEAVAKVQVVILRDPAGEQEARFDLTHGATLVSLRYHGNELLFGHSYHLF